MSIANTDKIKRVGGRLVIAFDCNVCKVVFFASKSNTLYCSGACSQYAYRQRKKKPKPEANTETNTEKKDTKIIQISDRIKKAAAVGDIKTAEFWQTQKDKYLSH